MCVEIKGEIPQKQNPVPRVMGRKENDMNELILAAFEKEKNHQPRQVRICFSWDNMEGVRVEQKIYADKLIKDWYSDCEHCPENDTALTSLMVGTTPIPQEALDRFVFEDMINLIESTWTFTRFNGLLSKQELSALRG